MDPSIPGERISLVDKAYTALVHAITTLELRPGESFSIKDISKRIGVGETPTREALAKVQYDGLVEVFPRKSIVVSNITINSVRSFFEAYTNTERQVVNLAARRASKDDIQEMRHLAAQINKHFADRNLQKMTLWNYRLHARIAKTAQNEFFLRTLNYLYLHSQRLSFIAFLGHGVHRDGEGLEKLDTIKHQHKEIIDYIENKNLKELDASVCEHINLLKQGIVNYIVSNELESDPLQVLDI